MSLGAGQRLGWATRAASVAIVAGLSAAILVHLVGRRAVDSRAGSRHPTPPNDVSPRADAPPRAANGVATSPDIVLASPQRVAERRARDAADLDPRHDGWDSEAQSEIVGSQLNRLATVLQAAEAVADERLRPLL